MLSDTHHIKLVALSNAPSHPYYCRLGDLLCFVFMSAYCMFDLSVYYLFLKYFDADGWVF